MLSEKQKRVLEIIIKYIEVNRISPTVRELADLSGLSSTSTIHNYIRILQRKGYIAKDPTKPRTIKIMKYI